MASTAMTLPSSAVTPSPENAVPAAEHGDQPPRRRARAAAAAGRRRGSASSAPCALRVVSTRRVLASRGRSTGWPVIDACTGPLIVLGDEPRRSAACSVSTMAFSAAGDRRRRSSPRVGAAQRGAGVAGVPRREHARVGPPVERAHERRALAVELLRRALEQDRARARPGRSARRRDAGRARTRCPATIVTDGDSELRHAEADERQGKAERRRRRAAAASGTADRQTGEADHGGSSSEDGAVATLGAVPGARHPDGPRARSGVCHGAAWVLYGCRRAALRAEHRAMSRSSSRPPAPAAERSVHAPNLADMVALRHRAPPRRRDCASRATAGGPSGPTPSSARACASSPAG